MCGRFALYNIKGMGDVFGVYNPLPQINLSYNIGPNSRIPIIYEDIERYMIPAGWGIAPLWENKENSVVFHSHLIINVRDDSLGKKKMFQNDFEKHRCLIPANGFYEWEKSGKRKVPYYIKTSDQPLFAFAGIYSPGKYSSGENHLNCSIITTDANEKVLPVHDRMPVILEKEDALKWIEKDLNAGDCLSLLKPYPAEKTALDVVGPDVNSHKSDNPSLIMPVSNPWW
ncbi:MAG: SOS response-associated peptidase [Methanomicrobiaceae archaeon]|nr:SOS response-associated peptidase [Methanomicrobiaceae archaeon]